MENVTGIWWRPAPQGAQVLRVLGDTPCPALPGELDGVPVTELGPYCFAEAAPALPADARLWGSAHPHAIAGLFVEQAVLPDGVHTLHNAAFYNCRQLRRLEVGPALRAAGCDLFTNCRALSVLALRAAPQQPTGLRRLLGALSADIEVMFLCGGQVAARLFYPEYWEVLDENAPAHLFDRGIEGEGYRYRQCFTDGAVDYAAYDDAFPHAASVEAPDRLCRLALGRLLWPYALRDGARRAYEGYLRGQPAAALEAAVSAREPDAIRLLCALGCAPAKAAQACARAGWSQGAAAVFAGSAAAAPRYELDDL